MKLICLFGSRARAYGIVVDSDKITESNEITLPTATILWECSTINEIENVKNRPPLQLLPPLFADQVKVEQMQIEREKKKSKLSPKFLLQH